MNAAAKGLETAIFAGGCFWCMEPVFDKIDGVVSVMPGYIGGDVPNPSYQEVCQGETGHAEAVRIHFDPAKVSYRELVRVFWRNIDPTTRNRQFCDYGTQYRTAIFYLDENQKRIAEDTLREVLEAYTFERPIATEIVPAGEFFEAEEYHQQYYKKEPYRYKQYHDNCGRIYRLKELWGEKH
ncbi:peptide methionine sulfoxide reductase MsrA [Geomonas sp. Red276]